MYFDSLADFLAMGKHGFYVWSAYGISAFLIITNMVLAVRAQSQVRQTLARQLRLEEQTSQQTSAPTRSQQSSKSSV